MVNLNNWARELTLKEGLKKSLSIAQVKEILKLILNDLKEMSLEDITNLLRRIK